MNKHSLLLYLRLLLPKSISNFFIFASVKIDLHAIYTVILPVQNVILKLVPLINAYLNPLCLMPRFSSL